MVLYFGMYVLHITTPSYNPIGKVFSIDGSDLGGKFDWRRLVSQTGPILQDDDIAISTSSGPLPDFQKAAIKTQLERSKFYTLVFHCRYA